MAFTKKINKYGYIPINPKSEKIEVFNFSIMNVSTGHINALIKWFQKQFNGERNANILHISTEFTNLNGEMRCCLYVPLHNPEFMERIYRFFADYSPAYVVDVANNLEPMSATYNTWTGGFVETIPTKNGGVSKPPTIDAVIDDRKYVTIYESSDTKRSLDDMIMLRNRIIEKFDIKPSYVHIDIQVGESNKWFIMLEYYKETEYLLDSTGIENTMNECQDLASISLYDNEGTKTE